MSYENGLITIKTSPSKLTEKLFPIPEHIMQYLSQEDMDTGQIEHIKAQKFIRKWMENVATEKTFTMVREGRFFNIDINGSIDVDVGQEGILEVGDCVVELKFGKAKGTLQYYHLTQLFVYMLETGKDGILIYTNYETGQSYVYYLKHYSFVLESFVDWFLALYFLRNTGIDDLEWYYIRRSLEKGFSIYVETAIRDTENNFTALWEDYCETREWSVVR